MPLKSYCGQLSALSAEQAALRDELRRHVEKLAGEIGERNVFKQDKLRAAAAYVEGSFSRAGYRVSHHSYEVFREPCLNLEAEIPSKTRREEVVIVGAHYDSVSGSPGANDNASGVAALLELARAWSGRETGYTLRFVAFVNEEPPFFQTEEMGSLVYARACKERGDNVVGMISMETIGYYSDAPASQHYPPPFNLFYPSTGNFIAFVGNRGSRAFLARCVGSFRSHTQFPCEGAAVPGFVTGIGWSDHWSFWQAGYPALMITDTAPFRYAHYHTAQDTHDKIDFDKTARVVAGTARVIADLAT